MCTLQSWSVIRIAVRGQVSPSATSCCCWQREWVCLLLGPPTRQETCHYIPGPLRWWLVPLPPYFLPSPPSLSLYSPTLFPSIPPSHISLYIQTHTSHILLHNTHIQTHTFPPSLTYSLMQHTHSKHHSPSYATHTFRHTPSLPPSYITLTLHTHTQNTRYQINKTNDVSLNHLKNFINMFKTS